MLLQALPGGKLWTLRQRHRGSSSSIWRRAREQLVDARPSKTVKTTGGE
eukprot:CAMPEP_0197888390 /NCGR_PEP_ID=MMETSP1439-20131203/21965_1 /TAXON_ID=66791 /ORGANISM="Gonyaulax spinifera, Strain CCMP409" /LENGTH=48 /DNA_ID= /DNA_START= /DNA_END= /DNA_ORIENTATION=